MNTACISLAARSRIGMFLHYLCWRGRGRAEQEQQAGRWQVGGGGDAARRRARTRGAQFYILRSLRL